MNRRGVVIILVALSLFLIAATIKSGWLYLVSSALVSLVLVGAVAGWRGTRRLELSRECPAEVFEGEPFPVRLRVTNTGRLGRSLVTVKDRQFDESKGRFAFLREIGKRQAEFQREHREALKGAVSEHEKKDPAGSSRSEAVTLERIGPASSLEIPYTLSAPVRGMYREADLAVVSEGVFGSASIKRSIKVDSPVTVFPGLHWIESFPFSTIATATSAESYEWSRRGLGQDYFGVREYVHGDSLRHIHWRSSARQGQLIVKEYQHEFHPAAALVVALKAPAYGSREENSLEDGLRAAASIANYYSWMGSPPAMVVPDDSGFTASEGTSLQECLRILAAYTPANGAALSGALSLAGREFGPGRVLAVVTNLSAAEVAASLPDLGASELSLILVVDVSYDSRQRGEQEPGGYGLETLDALAGQIQNIYLVASGREISECLNEPLVTTAS